MKKTVFWLSFASSPRMICTAGLILLGILSLWCAFPEVTLSGNDATRFAVIQAVGEQGVFHIEDTEFRTVDAVRRGGHVYSDKPLPLGWTIGMIHRGVHTLTGLSFTQHYALLVWLYNAVIGFAVNALLFCWLFRMFRRIRRGNLAAKGILALGGVCSTWIFSYSVLLNNHTPAALAVLGVYIMLTKYRQVPSASLAWGIGAGAGLVAALDIPLGGIWCVAAVLAVWQMSRKESAIYTAAGAGIMLVLQGALNFWAYGTWVPLYLAGSTGTFQPSLNLSAGYWVECLIGWRGLFLYLPFLLPGLLPRKQDTVPDRWMYSAALAGIAFYCVGTNEFGGAAYGFRYLIPVIPVLYYRTGKLVLESPQPAYRKATLAGALLLWGTLTSAAGAYAPFCVAFEGYRSPAGHFTRVIRSSFGGNLLCASFEYAPDSRLTEMLIRHYGPANAFRFLYESYFNIKRPDLIRQTLNRAKEMP